jgi:hypothetical protein
MNKKYFFPLILLTSTLYMIPRTASGGVNAPINANQQPSSPTTSPSTNSNQVTQQQLQSELQSMLATPDLPQQTILNINSLLVGVNATTDPNVLATYVPMISQLQMSIQKQSESGLLKPIAQGIITQLQSLNSNPSITQNQQAAALQLINQIQNQISNNTLSSKSLVSINNQVYQILGQVNKTTGAGQSATVIINNIKNILNNASQSAIMMQKTNPQQAQLIQAQISLYNQQLTAINPTDINSLNSLLQTVTNYTSQLTQTTTQTGDINTVINSIKLRLTKIGQKLSSLTPQQQAQYNSINQQMSTTPTTMTQVNTINNQLTRLENQISNTAGQNIGQRNTALGKIYATIQDKNSLMNVCASLNALPSLPKGPDGSTYVLIIAEQPNHDGQWNTQFTTQLKNGLNFIWTNQSNQQLSIPIIEVLLDTNNNSYNDLAPIRIGIEQLPNPTGTKNWYQYYPGIYLTTTNNLINGGTQFTPVTQRKDVDTGQNTALPPQALAQKIVSTVNSLLPQKNNQPNRNINRG